MADRTIKKGDTWPPLRATLTVRDIDDPADSDASPVMVPLDLTDADGVVAFVRLGSSAPLEWTCTFISRPLGRVEHDFAVGETDVVGSYEVEFKVTWAVDDIETVPNSGTRTLVIEEDLEDD